MSSYSIALAGSTTHTVQCAEAIIKDGLFDVRWILTPPPKPIGRKQILTKNPLHVFAEEHQIPVIFVEQKIDQNVKDQVLAHHVSTPLDFLLVVDFGYLVPKWLLELPKLAPLNVHPSNLPRWRGSSPGQFVLLYGEKNSAVTLMVMGPGLDNGPVVYQEEFAVDPNWTQQEYYRYSFTETAKWLSQKIIDLAEKKILPVEQPIESPTPVAGKLRKEDSFVEWELLKACLENSPVPTSREKASPLLQEVFAQLGSWPEVLANATRAFALWPTLWTKVSTRQGEKRLQILESHISSDEKKLVLVTAKLEGKDTQPWSELKKLIL